MKKKNKNLSQSLPEHDFLTAASSTDCTGIVPSAPQNENELEAYLDIMKFSPKSVDVNKKH